MPALTYSISFLRGGQKGPKSRFESSQAGAMLAHFSHWDAFFRSWPLLGHFFGTFRPSCPFFLRFFGFLVALDSILHGLGQFLEPSKPHFSMFFGVSQHTSQKCSSCSKTTVFAMFYRLRHMSHTATERVFCIAFRALLDTVHGLLQKIPDGIHFLLFKTTLQRGGTCEAHGIGPKCLRRT